MYPILAATGENGDMKWIALDGQARLENGQGVVVCRADRGGLKRSFALRHHGSYAAPIGAAQTSTYSFPLCFSTSSHSPRPHILGHGGNSCCSVKRCGVLQTLHQ